MANVRTRSFIPNVEDEVETVLSILENVVGNVYYVSTSGLDANDGLTWDTAFRTLIYAISQCSSGNGDVIFVAPGIYDENVNGANGITVSVANILIRGVGEGVLIKNSNTDNNGRVFYVTGDFTVISNVGIEKGETTDRKSVV